MKILYLCEVVFHYFIDMEALNKNIQNSRNRDTIHFIVMSVGLFCKEHNLTRREACNYLSRYGGMKFAIDHYEVEHQLSMRECVNDMSAICKKNGGVLQ
jgi:hypothetical protein